MKTTCVKEKNGVYFFRGEGAIPRETLQWERWQGSYDPIGSNFYFLKSDTYNADEVFTVKTQYLHGERYGWNDGKAVIS